MEPELRHRDKSISRASEESSSTEEYNGDIKKNMKCSYGKTPNGTGKKKLLQRKKPLKPV